MTNSFKVDGPALHIASGKIVRVIVIDGEFVLVSTPSFINYKFKASELEALDMCSLAMWNGFSDAADGLEWGGWNEGAEPGYVPKEPDSAEPVVEERVPDEPAEWLPSTYGSLAERVEPPLSTEGPRLVIPNEEIFSEVIYANI